MRRCCSRSHETSRRYDRAPPPPPFGGAGRHAVSLGGLSRDRITPWTAADVAWALLPALSVAFVLSGMLIGSTMDEEEYRNIIASVVLEARALRLVRRDESRQKCVSPSGQQP